MAEESKPKSTRGFASMSAEQRREIASKGGRSVPKEKRSFSLNRALAKEAGKKGGLAIPPDKRAYSLDRNLASDAGRKGGHAMHEKGGS